MPGDWSTQSVDGSWGLEVGILVRLDVKKRRGMPSCRRDSPACQLVAWPCRES